ncbi:hypothetical protein ACP4OV_030208 [Aristida adscensionis]
METSKWRRTDWRGAGGSSMADMGSAWDGVVDAFVCLYSAADELASYLGAHPCCRHPCIYIAKRWIGLSYRCFGNGGHALPLSNATSMEGGWQAVVSACRGSCCHCC